MAFSRCGRIATIALSLFSFVFSMTATNMTATVYWNGVVWSIQRDILDPNGCVFGRCAVAYGSFANTLNVTGWSVLNIKTNGNSTDVQQHFGAGFLESYFTADQIYMTYLNNMNFTFRNGVVPPAVEAFMNSQDAWARVQVQANPTDPFWQVIKSTG